jgi:hypothetical protein
MDALSLTTERLLLREFRESDWATVHEYAPTSYPWPPTGSRPVRWVCDVELSFACLEEAKEVEL